jgi:hypothetical protein
MPPRKLNKTNAQKHELEAFAEKYDILAMVHGDPVETIFQIMAASEQEEVRLRAADMLMSYRYPRMKAAEGTPQNAPVLNFNVTMPPQVSQTSERVVEMRPVPAPKRLK